MDSKIQRGIENAGCSAAGSTMPQPEIRNLSGNPRVVLRESRDLSAPIDKRQHKSSGRIGLDTHVNCMQSKTSFLQHVVLEYQLVLQSTTALLSLYINQGSNG